MTKEINKQGKIGDFLGYKIIKDNRVKEIRMPQKVIDNLAETIEPESDEPEKQEETTVPTRVIVCTTCGFKEPLKKDQNASTSVCKQCGRKGLSVR